MSMPIPKAGFTRFMKDGAQYYKGVDEVVLRNIDACVELGNQTRSSYGPYGMNKMVINHIEKIFVTNDGATMLREIAVEHPAAKMIVMSSEMQDKQIGDGTNFVVIFSAALLEHASQLINMGIKPVEVASGYETALEKALQVMPSLIVKEAVDLHDPEEVKQYLKAVVMTKLDDNHDIIAELVAKACVQTVPKDLQSFNVDNIRICKILGGGVKDSKTVNGMVFQRPAEGVVKKVNNASIAVFACPFDLTQTETKGTVMVETAEELLNFSAGEEKEVENLVKGLADKGVNVVVSGGKFGDLYLHFLNKYNIMGVRITSKFDLRRLCRTTGAQAQALMCVPDKKFFGVCERVFSDEIGSTSVVVFDKLSEHGNVATIVIRGSSGSRLDHVERAIDDAVNTYKALIKDPRLLAGAGAFEIELSKQIESYGEKFAGLEQYSIQKFAFALECVPKNIAENSGFKPSEVLSLLYERHESGFKNCGLDIKSGDVLDAAEEGIFDLFINKMLALKLATVAAVNILNIDQIIMAKQVTGPKPRDPKAADED